MKKSLKVLGLVILLVVFWFAAELLASFVIGSSRLVGLLLTAIPALLFGFLTALATGRRWWLLSGLAAAGFVTGAIFGFPTIGKFTVFERAVTLTAVPIACAFLGGFLGGRVRI